MVVRALSVFFVAAFGLVIAGGLLGTASVTVPWAAAFAPAGGDDDDDDEGPDLDELDCDELIELTFDIISGEVHEEFIDLEKLKMLVAKCAEGGSPSRVSLQERLISGLPFSLDFLGDGNFVGVAGTYDPATGNYTGNGVGTVAGFANVTVVLALNIDNAGNITGTYTMGAGGELPGGVPAVYAVSGVFPLTATPTPTPSPTDTPVPTASPAGQQATWADNNCKDGVNPVDSLLVLRADAGLSANTNECPPMGASIDVQNASPHIWGNVDCKDGMNPVDSLKILRHDAGLSASQEAGCPAMGSAVTITEL